MTKRLDELLAKRAELLEEFLGLEDMRQGSISENYRRCGSPGCHCAAPDHPGHGPYYAFTRRVAGKTKTINRRPGPELDELRREVGEYQRFRDLCRQLLELNECICDARSVGEQAPGCEVGSKDQER